MDKPLITIKIRKMHIDDIKAVQHIAEVGGIEHMMGLSL